MIVRARALLCFQLRTNRNAVLLSDKRPGLKFHRFFTSHINTRKYIYNVRSGGLNLRRGRSLGGGGTR